ncbi:MAG: alpha-glucan family phosphorylase [Phycisphaerales bacterium]|jgi:starch phosphorylase|nr:alpha-glucan family phosphorylase [Phycisphaerales bacterium]
MPNPNHTIAYLSLEIGLDASIPTYSGGLGVLAGDTIRAAADVGLPYAAVTLLYRKGYFKQSIDEWGMQQESPVAWKPEDYLDEMPQRSFVPIEGRTVWVRAYRLMVTGVRGHAVPVYFLDTDLPENDPRDREITHSLYAGGHDLRIKQEAVLGIAGRRMLRAVTHDCSVFHMNEGHGCFLTVELMSEFLARHRTFEITPAAVEYVKRQCVFTTHTPVEAGHDRFDVRLVKQIIGEHPLFDRVDLISDAAHPGVLNTTRMALNLSRYANGVARKHGEVSRAMFPGYAIDSVTNGVHHLTWVHPKMRELFDEMIPSWRTSPNDLRKALGLATERIMRAHAACKKDLIEHANKHSVVGGGAQLREDAFTIGFARRSTAYKRPELVFSDLIRLRAMAKQHGPIQIVFAGKAHPHDGRGKEILQHVFEIGRALATDKGASGGDVRVALLPNYDMALAAKIVAGSDIWLNTPVPPMEASGTSGMKAAINGVASLSTLDGWWLEGWVEGVTGWAVGEAPGSSGSERAADDEALTRAHADSLYTKLERDILPTFRNDPERWASIMRSSIALNGSYFTTQRMIRDYVLRAYLD